MSDDNDKKYYEVGYGKPPKHTRFGAEKGNSRNTNGRPPGRNVLEFDRLSEEALWDCFLQAAQMPVSLTEKGEDMTVPYVMALAKRMAQDAFKGDHHARRDLLRMLEKATKGSDKLFHDLHMAMASHEERRIKALAKPGSLEFYDSKYTRYMYRRYMRPLVGGEEFMYEPGEPVIDEDWAVFIGQYEYLKANPSHDFPWPPKYPSDDVE